MFTLSEDQYSAIGELVETRFAERLMDYLERNCPSVALPAPGAARMAFARERISVARKAGLTWQSTISEHARLSTLRRAGQRVVNPDKLAGNDRRFANVRFTQALQRAALVNRVKAR